VVLRQREPVPDRVTRDRVAVGVLPEVAEEVPLLAGGDAAELQEAGPQVRARVGAAAEREGGPEPSHRLLPGIREEEILQLAPAPDRDLVHDRPPNERLLQAG